VHGPSVVLRILRPDAVNIGIESLGFEQDNYEQFQDIIKRPNGIFLVTGPPVAQDDDPVRRLTGVEQAR